MEVKSRIDNTIVAIRENLMEYFKDNCIEKLALTPHNVSRQSVGSSGHYYFERRENELRRESVIKIGQIPILLIQKSPDRVTFYDKTLNRSTQFRQVSEEIDMFLEKFLQGVERVRDATK